MGRSLIVGILLLAGTVTAQEAKDFRSTEGYGETRWGMPKREVLAVVPGLKDAKTGLAMEGQVVGKSAIIVYVFAEDRLTIAGINFTEKYVNKNNYLVDYRELQGLLAKKYGPPKQEQTLWSQTLYRDRPDEWGMALSAGHVVMHTTWETEKTDIELSCRGEKFDITVQIRYASKELKDLQKRQSEKDKLKGL
jgi:hypothetical protein